MRTAVACLLGLGVWQLGQGAVIPAKAWLAQELLKRAWARATEGEPRAHPWPWADTWPVARLSAEDGPVDLIVLAGASGRTLAFGPAHLDTSPLPGERGNSVLTGHRDTHFRFLERLSAGTILSVETPNGSRHRYTVTAADVVDSRRSHLVLDTVDARLTLVTCYPFDAERPGGPLRYVVTAMKSGEVRQRAVPLR